MVKNGTEARDERGRFAPGNAGGPGRPKGRSNKINATLKEDVLAAYQQRGGIEWLASLPDRDFLHLLAKILPRELAACLAAGEEGAVNVSINVHQFEPQEGPLVESVTASL